LRTDSSFTIKRNFETARGSETERTLQNMGKLHNKEKAHNIRKLTPLGCRVLTNRVHQMAIFIYLTVSDRKIGEVLGK
jgi:hypothetical protein